MLAQTAVYQQSRPQPRTVSFLSRVIISCVYGTMFYFSAGGQGTVFRDQSLLPLYNALEIELGAPGLCSSHLSLWVISLAHMTPCLRVIASPSFLRWNCLWKCLSAEKSGLQKKRHRQRTSETGQLSHRMDTRFKGWVDMQRVMSVSLLIALCWDCH